MKVLVTGASGFIGRPLVARLVAKGLPVRALVRRADEAQSLPEPRSRSVTFGTPARWTARPGAWTPWSTWRPRPGVARAAVARDVNAKGTRR
jgi:NAD(P)-dependent dehydrogenase (short-subunit alcohol dehydrogenase family)